MKRKPITAIITVAVIIFIAVAVFVGNILLTDLADGLEVELKGQKFATAEEAVEALEALEVEEADISLDYCPPHDIVYSFDYEDKTIVIMTYSEKTDYDDTDSYAVRVLKRNDDNTYSFDIGFAELLLKQPSEDDNYYYFTNINTSEGKKSMCFLYLDKDSEKDVYVDGNKAEKLEVTIDGHDFYLCYAVSSPDTIIKNSFTSISSRHKIEIK